MINSPKKSTLSQRIFAALFFSIFLLMGLAFFFFMVVKPVAKGIQARSWPAVACRIESSEVRTHPGKKGTTYSVEIAYRYQFQGREYRGDRYQFLRISSSGRTGKAAVVAGYPKGGSATCFVNPGNPGEAVLDRGIDSLWFGLIPLVFVVIGGAGVYGAIRGGNSEPPPTEESQAKPWLMRADWAAGRIVSSSKKALGGAWIFAGLWNLISTPLIIATVRPEMFREGPKAFLVLVFPILGLGLLVYAIRLTLRWARFGDAVFELAQVPAALGGTLEGIIRPAKPVRLDGAAMVRIACVSGVTSGSGSSRSTRESVLWQHEETVIPGEGGSIPVAFRLPADASETTTLGNVDGILWRLELKGRVLGGDCGASFEVPVFRVTITPEQEARAQRLAVEEKTELASYVQSRNSPIRVQAAPGGGMEFLFPARRNLAATLLPPLGGLIFVALFFAVALQAHAPVFVQVLLGGFVALLGYGVLYSVGASKRVVVRPDAVEVTSSLLGIGRVRRIPAGEIAEIKSKSGMQVGSSFYQTVKITAVGGKEFDASGQIKDGQEAEWIAAEMTKALGRI